MNSRPLAFAEAKSPGVFGTGLEDFTKVAADLGDLRDPAVREFLDGLKPTHPRAKVLANGCLLCPKTGYICPSVLTASSLVCSAASPRAWTICTLTCTLGWVMARRCGPP